MSILLDLYFYWPIFSNSGGLKYAEQSLIKKRKKTEKRSKKKRKKRIKEKKKKKRKKGNTERFCML